MAGHGYLNYSTTVASSPLTILDFSPFLFIAIDLELSGLTFSHLLKVLQLGSSACFANSEFLVARIVSLAYLIAPYSPGMGNLWQDMTNFSN